MNTDQNLTTERYYSCQTLNIILFTYLRGAELLGWKPPTTKTLGPSHWNCTRHVQLITGHDSSSFSFYHNDLN